MRHSRRRRVILWLSDANEPVSFHLQWYQDDELQREIYCGFAAGLEFERCVRILDSLPRTLDPQVLSHVGWARPGNTNKGTHRLKFDMPGWAETNRGHDWYLPIQPPLPFPPK